MKVSKERIERAIKLMREAQSTLLDVAEEDERPDEDTVRALRKSHEWMDIGVESLRYVQGQPSEGRS